MGGNFHRNSHYPQRKFTIDGRLVGDIGEVVAELDYDIILYEKQTKDYDAITPDNKKVQIKASFKESLTFKTLDGYYIGLKFNPDGTYKEIYNGPASKIFQEFKQRKNIGKELISIPISTLERISLTVSEEDRVSKY